MQEAAESDPEYDDDFDDFDPFEFIKNLPGPSPGVCDRQPGHARTHKYTCARIHVLAALVASMLRICAVRKRND